MPNPLALNAAMNPFVQQLLQQQQQNFQASLISILKQQQSLPETTNLDKSFPNFLGNSTSAVGDGNGNSLERAARFHRSAACKSIFFELD